MTKSTAYEFGENGGLISFTFPVDRRPDTKKDHLVVGFITKRDNGIIFRIDSGFSIDFMELQIVDGYLRMTYNLGTVDQEIRDYTIRVNDDQFHIVRFSRSGANSSIQIDKHKAVTRFPPGKQLTMLNSHAKLQVGGRKSSIKSTIEMPFHGIMSGVVFNGLHLLDMAAERDPRVIVDGDIKMLGSSAAPKSWNSNMEMRNSLLRNPPQMQQPKTAGNEDDELIISGEGSGCLDDDECSSFTDAGSGDEIITPVYISPKTTSVTPLYQRTSTVKPTDLRNKICDDEEEDDCFDGSGSGESMLTKTNDNKPYVPSTPQTSTQWITPPHYRPPPPVVPTVDYDDRSILHTSKPIPPPAIPPFQVGRNFKTTPRTIVRPSGKPEIYEVPIPEMPSTEKEITKPTTTYNKTSAYRTALVIGLIAIILIVIVIIAPIVVFIKVKYRTGGIFKSAEGKNFQFMPVSGTPPLLGSGSQQTHLNGTPSRTAGDQKAPKLPKKKNLKEWYV
ncbi:neurexin-1-like protein [Leptotrombidium deliense]|uniref:Neurexin-1-like protein n=1 Tax=Leptotrombidium deliense TaxID=299467 RepID=A0A443SRK5_9ACAR|nr:neurexin-1-like protein [Leptotrombidium deliense]